jgi:Cdc6-like AAA superfamily ATPase
VSTLKEWFFLKPTRDNFKLKVREDAGLIFCHDEEIHHKVIGNIELRFASNEPIKMLIYGDWGVGKTHTAYHIAWWLQENRTTYPAHAVMVEVGDLEKKSRFDVLVRPFLEELGVDFLVELASAFQLQVGGNTVGALREAGVPEYVATTVAKLNLAAPKQTPPPAVIDAIGVLQGRKPSPGLASIGLGHQLTESKDFFYVLYAIGYMYLRVHRHRLVFIADEAARLGEVSNDEATEAHWVAVHRDIFDDKNNVFGFIYTLTGKASKLPKAISDPQIQNRIGQSGVELLNLRTQDVSEYVTRLVSEVVDMPQVSAAVNAETIDPTRFDAASYPFDTAGRARFLDFFQRTQHSAKPRDISDRLDQVGFIALKEGKRLIDEASIERANM